MNKTELKNGYIVKLRNGEEMMVVLDSTFKDLPPADILMSLDEPGEFIPLNHYLDMTYSGKDKGKDIVEVSVATDFFGNRELLWKRAELRKGNLYNGCIVTLRNGDKMMVMKGFKGTTDVLMNFEKNEYDLFSAYEDDLKHTSRADWDIVDVYFANSPTDFIPAVLGEED